MATMNVSLPDEMKAFVEAQAAKEGFGTTSEYLRSVIRDVQKRLAKQALEAKLREGADEWSRRAHDPRGLGRDRARRATNG